MFRAGWYLALFGSLLATLGVSAEVQLCKNEVILIGGAVGISLVSILLTLLVSCICRKACKGKKTKVDQGDEEEASLQYASLQNLPMKAGDAVRQPQEDPGDKTCYASVVDLRNEIQNLEQKEADGAAPEESH